MKTVNDAVNLIYSAMKGNGILIPIYLFQKPTQLQPDQYYVVNGLPISSGVMQSCKVNVNFFAKDIAPGIPNLTSLESGANSIVSMFVSYADNTNGIYVELYSQSVARSDSSGEHYTNVKLNVTFLN